MGSLGSQIAGALGAAEGQPEGWAAAGQPGGGAALNTAWWGAANLGVTKLS